MTGWKIVALAIVALGIVLRFVNLDKKPYWMDEAATSLRVSGYRPSEVKKEVFNGQEITVADIQKYQHINPDRGLLHTVLSLVASDPEHPPLYFVLARIWAGVVGDSPMAMRVLVAIIAIFTIPAVFWLCLELFQSQVTAWVAMVLMAVSPFQLIYAQEARPYSLLALMTIVSTALFMRATRLQKSGPWRAYAVAVGIGLYTHLMFAGVLLAHGICLFIVTWRELGVGRNAWIALKPFLLAAATAVLIFVPWIIVIMLRLGQFESCTSWLRVKLDLSILVRSWNSGICSVFVDPKNDIEAPWDYLVQWPVLLLISFSIYFLWRTASMRISLLVIALILCTAIPLMVPDLVMGGRRSAIPRYWVPAYVGFQIAMAYLLATQIKNARPVWRRFWQATTATVVAAGVMSCAIIAHAETWWNKADGLEIPRLAQVVNRADSPLLIASGSPAINFGYLLSLSHTLDKKVRIRLTLESRLPPLEHQMGDVFVFNPSEKMKRGLEQYDGHRTLVPLSTMLWRWQDKQEVIAQP